MNRYLLQRLLLFVPTLLVTSLVVFLIVSLAPGDPLSQFAANPAVPPEVSANLRRVLGLDQPWPIRYVKWLTNLVMNGDLGYSFTSRMPVSALILQRLGTTLAVLGTAYVLSIAIAIPIGILSAIKQYSLFDHLATTFAFIGFSVPTFFTAMLLILVFGVQLHWFPWIYDSTLQVTDSKAFMEIVRQSVLPVTVITLFQTGTLTRYVRATVLENLTQDYVRTARGKGLRELLVIWRHVFRNSLIPMVTLLALGVPAIFTGALVTEQIFRVPGIGSLLVASIETSDTPVIMAIICTYAVLVVIFNLVADVIYTFLDPRIRYD
ncbi:Dipeptide transport system permease protein DppB [Anaerolineae bacterium]|nr:Dipeptide transport system permease protein DppB [Anaerolineae bacterium]